MRIALDAMGGDRAPGEIVRGGVEAARRLGVEIALVGDGEVVGRALKECAGTTAGIAVVHATEAVAMDEHGATAARHKRQSSINVGLREVKEGRAAAFVSAGNTGAVMAGAVLTLGRARGI